MHEAALCGRDIEYDQNYKYNLLIRKTLEGIISTESHDTSSDDFQKLSTYAKRVWFSNGIHHHYNHDKIIPECSEEFFTHVLSHVDAGLLPLQANQSKEDFIKFVTPLIFDPTIASKRVSLDSKTDLVKSSAVNFYEGVSQQEVMDFYAKQVNKNSTQNPMYGLNTKLVKENGKLVEKVWMLGGMYSSAIEKIVYWLEQASTVAENENQQKALLA